MPVHAFEWCGSGIAALPLLTGAAVPLTGRIGGCGLCCGAALRASLRMENYFRVAASVSRPLFLQCIRGAAAGVAANPVVIITWVPY